MVSNEPKQPESWIVRGALDATRHNNSMQWTALSAAADAGR